MQFIGSYHLLHLETGCPLVVVFGQIVEPIPQGKELLPKTLLEK